MSSSTAALQRLYCARGEAEHRIKEAQLDRFGRCANCHKFQANQLRQLVAALAYTRIIRLPCLALHDAELERAGTATIRTKRLKIGAALVRHTRCIHVVMASHNPLKHVFFAATQAPLLRQALNRQLAPKRRN